MRLDLTCSLADLQQWAVIQAALDPAWRRQYRQGCWDRGAWIFGLFCIVALLTREVAVFIAGLLFVVYWWVAAHRAWKHRVARQTREQAFERTWRFPMPCWVESDDATVTSGFGPFVWKVPWSSVAGVRHGGRVLVLDVPFLQPIALYAPHAADDDWTRFVQDVSRRIVRQGGDVQALGEVPGVRLAR